MLRIDGRDVEKLGCEQLNRSEQTGNLQTKKSANTPKQDKNNSDINEMCLPDRQ